MIEKIKFIPREPREVDRTPDDEARRKMSEALKGKRQPKSQGKAIRENWQRMFIAQHPLKPGEIYLRFRHPRRKYRTIEQVIVIASDAHRVEYSRDGENWKIAKKRNPHAES